MRQGFTAGSRVAASVQCGAACPGFHCQEDVVARRGGYQTACLGHLQQPVQGQHIVVLFYPEAHLVVPWALGQVMRH